MQQKSCVSFGKNAALVLRTEKRSVIVASERAGAYRLFSEGVLSESHQPRTGKSTRLIMSKTPFPDSENGSITPPHEEFGF